MAITNDSDLIAALVNAARLPFYKTSQTSEGAATWHSLWKATGLPAAGATPAAFGAGSGYTPDDATVGAMGFTNPTAPDLSYLARLAVTGATVGTLILYDRVWHCSGFGTVITTEQTITTPGTPPSGRDPNAGADIEPWLEVYTAPGATTATWTFKGTDADGTTDKTWTYTHPANAESVGQMMPLVPGGGAPAAKLGCRAAKSFQANTTSGTAGDIGITLLRRLCEIPINIVNIGAVLDAIGTGLPRVYDDSCLALMMQCSTTNTGVIQGHALLGRK